MSDVVVTSTRVVLPDAVRAAAVRIENGCIVAVEDRAAVDGESNGVVDYGDLVVFPGLVDTHVHVDEPGRTDWEGFDTATRAAAAGGVTTIVDMPLNSIPATTTVAALERKRGAARRGVHVDVAFWGGVVPGNTAHLEPLIDAGVRGFKCFLAPSGVDEFRHVGEKELREAMPILARRNVPLLVHAEDPTLLLSGGDDVDGAAVLAGPDYASYVASRPAAAERSAVELMIRLAREYGTEVHIVHVTCREAVEAIERAKAAGVRITAESCPHYLTFAAAEIPAGATEFKCAPPIRDGRDRDALWKALRSGALDLVVTDHSPAPRELKATGDFRTAWGGIASLELSLPAVWTGVAQQLAARASSSRSRSRSRRDESGMRDAAPARRRRRPSATERALVSLARWMSEAPARLAKLGACKGCIAEGYDGDLVVWDPEREWIVDPSRLQQRHKITPYAGRLLRGVVCASYVRGRPVWSDGALRTPCAGDLL